MTIPQLQQQVNPDQLKMTFADIAAENDATNTSGTPFEVHCRAIGLNPASDPEAAVILGIDSPPNGGLGTTLMRRRGILRPQRWIRRLWLKRPVTAGKFGLNVPADAGRLIIFDLFLDDAQAIYSGGDGDQGPKGVSTWLITGGTNNPGGLTQLLASNGARGRARIRNIAAAAATRVIGPAAAGGQVITLGSKEVWDEPYKGAVFGQGALTDYEVEELA